MMKVYRARYQFSHKWVARLEKLSEGNDQAAVSALKLLLERGDMDFPSEEGVTLETAIKKLGEVIGWRKQENTCNIDLYMRVCLPQAVAKRGLRECA